MFSKFWLLFPFKEVDQPFAQISNIVDVPIYQQYLGFYLREELCSHFCNKLAYAHAVAQKGIL